MPTTWWVLLLLAADWINGLRTSWFPRSRASIDDMHEAGLGLHQVAVYLFHVIPRPALTVMGRDRDPASDCGLRAGPGECVNRYAAFARV